MRESSWREQEALETKLRQTEQARTSLLANQSSLRSSLQQHQAVIEEKDAQREKESGHMSSLEVSPAGKSLLWRQARYNTSVPMFKMPCLVHF